MNNNFLIKTHFLGAKIKHLRKSSRMTLEDLCVRCFQIDKQSAPSISYLSLIENGQRKPSDGLLDSICKIFHREKEWFFDQSLLKNNEEDIASEGFESINLEPNFLFSKDILGKALPALLSQTGTSGRKFAHTLIRSYQEKNYNQFPYIEKEADLIGKKKFPLSYNDIIDLYKYHNLKIKWFEKNPFMTKDDLGQEIKSLFRSFYDGPKYIYINSKMKSHPSRIKYDLCTYLAHKVLHGGDGIVSSHVTGGEIGGSPRPHERKTSTVNQKDILYAWRDFECSFFAGALLCPRMPFRKYMNRVQYDITKYNDLELTPAVLMRRLTAVSPYKYWHYFDAYPPGYLRAVYRGNGMPMPWENFKTTKDSYDQLGVFKHLANLNIKRPISQLSIIKQENSIKLYCSVSLKTNDAAGNPHVICSGIELNEAISMQGYNTEDILNDIYTLCYKNKGSSNLTDSHKKIFTQIGIILNISWVIEAIDLPVNIFASSLKINESTEKGRKKISWTNQIKQEILKTK